jgi:hypothetical protein
MALIWLDGCNSYSSTANGSQPYPTNIISRRYGSVSAEIWMDVEAGYRAGTSLELNLSSWIYTSELTTNTTLIVGAAIFTYEVNDPQNGIDGMLIGLQEGAANSLTLRQYGSGLALFVGTTLIAHTTRFHLLANAWSYIEIKANCHDTDGYYEVRVNGVNVLSGGPTDTKGSTLGYYNRVKFTAPQGTLGRVTDIYVCDGSGNTNNDFLGPVQIDTLTPDGDVTNEWETGNYLDVDDDITDDDTTLATANAAGKLRLSYDATLAFDTIKGIAVSGTFKTDASINVALTANSSGNETASANITYNSANYTTKSFIVELEPGTANAWTPATVNAAAFGIEYL